MFRSEFRIAYSSHGHTLSMLRTFYFKFAAKHLFSIYSDQLSQTALHISEADYQWYQKFHSLRQNIASVVEVMQGKELGKLSVKMRLKTRKPSRLLKYILTFKAILNKS